jgi:hypothetical protein
MKKLHLNEEPQQFDAERKRNNARIMKSHDKILPILTALITFIIFFVPCIRMKCSDEIRDVPLQQAIFNVYAQQHWSNQ